MAIEVLDLATSGSCLTCCPRWHVECCPYICGLPSRMVISTSIGDGVLFSPGSDQWNGFTNEAFDLPGGDAGGGPANAIWQLHCDAGVWKLTLDSCSFCPGAPFGPETALTSECDPFRLDFLLTGVDEVGDVTVTITLAPPQFCHDCCCPGAGSMFLMGPLSWGDGDCDCGDVTGGEALQAFELHFDSCVYRVTGSAAVFMPESRPCICGSGVGTVLNPIWYFWFETGGTGEPGADNNRCKMIASLLGNHPDDCDTGDLVYTEFGRYEKVFDHDECPFPDSFEGIIELDLIENDYDEFGYCGDPPTSIQIFIDAP